MPPPPPKNRGGAPGQLRCIRRVFVGVDFWTSTFKLARNSGIFFFLFTGVGKSGKNADFASPPFRAFPGATRHVCLLRSVEVDLRILATGWILMARFKKTRLRAEFPRNLPSTMSGRKLRSGFSEIKNSWQIFSATRKTRSQLLPRFNRGV